MAIIRQGNWLPSQRLDVSHIKAVESAISADFDNVAGILLAGKKPMIVSGFNILNPQNMAGVSATSLQVNVANSIVVHYGASESGTVFVAPASPTTQTLSTSNSKVQGTFTANQTNYIGIDFVRTADSSTAGLVKFKDSVTGQEIGKTVPLARILDYTIVISTTDFSSSPTICPIAKVVTDPNNNVQAGAIVDARNLMFRLGSGGDAPNAKNVFAFGSRAENTTGDIFTGGDKNISSLKNWMDSIMTRVWEIGGGEYWYSQTADRNVAVVWDGVATFSASNTNWLWDGTNLSWKGVKLLFSNSTAQYNTVTDNTGGLALADGECLYVDVDRTQNAVLTAAKGALTTLGDGTIPGSRFVIAWRSGSKCYVRGTYNPLGTSLPIATPSALGIVQLNNAPGNNAVPLVPAVGANGQLDVAATANNSYAIKGTGIGNGDGVRGSASGTGYGLRALAGGAKIDAGSLVFPDNTSQKAAAPFIQTGTAANGDTITFATPYATTPAIFIVGGVSYEPGARWSSDGHNGVTGGSSPSASTAQIDDVAALNASTTGFKVRARLWQKGSTSVVQETIPSSGTVVSGNLTTPNIGGNSPSNATNPAPGANDQYTINFQYSLSITGGTGGGGSNSSSQLTVGIWYQTSSGGTWTEVTSAKQTYSIGGTSNSVSNVAKSISVTVPGMTSTGAFRVQTDNFVVNDMSIDGNASGTYSFNISSTQAVTYNYNSGTPDIYASKTPDTGDTVTWIAIGHI